MAVTYLVDDSDYANIGKGSRSRSQLFYWRSMAVMFASARKYFPAEADFRIFSNASPPSAIAPLLESLGVRIVRIGFEHAPPPGFWHRYRGTFHVVDVIRHFSDIMNPEDRVLLVDPDCVWVRDPSSLLQLLDRDEVVCQECFYPAEFREMGVSRVMMQQFFQDLSGRQVTGPPAYFGGELFGFTGEAIKTAAVLADEIWNYSLRRHEDGLEHPNTEEHLMSYVLWAMGFSTGNANDYVRRLWSGPPYRNVSANVRDVEFGLSLWHLPGEKKRGLNSLYKSLRSPDSAFWRLRDDAFKTYVADRTGILRTPRRRLDDVLRRHMLRIKHGIRTPTALRPPPSASAHVARK